MKITRGHNYTLVKNKVKTQKKYMIVGAIYKPPATIVESKYELIAREHQKNCKKTFYDVFLNYCV